MNIEHATTSAKLAEQMQAIANRKLDKGDVLGALDHYNCAERLRGEVVAFLATVV